MGKWTLESVNGMSNALDGDTFGTNFHATFTMRYSTSTFGSYTETPKLDWHEKIIMKEHHKREWWVFETNMYEHNPLSATLKIWAGRYVEAYNHAAGMGTFGKGKSQLLDKNRMPVQVAKLGKNIANDTQRAKAVRDYLKANGGYLIITVHDIPSINRLTGTDHKERLLLFNVGVEGQALRCKAAQYLDVDGAKPSGQWGRQFTMDWRRDRLDTTGFKSVPPPPMVANRQAPMFVDGECW